MRLAGKVALITGAGRGIGLAVAQAYAREGASLALCSRSEEAEKAAAALKAGGAAVFAQRCDVADASQARRFAQDAAARFGRLDICVNNAGLLGPRVGLLEYPAADWKAVLDANVNGAFYILQACGLVMRKQRSGCIINVSSGTGRHPRLEGGAYAVSKAAVEFLTRAAALELKEHGVRVNAFNPGPTRTALRRQYAPDEDPAAVKAPEDLAWAFVELAAATDGATGISYDADMAGRRLVLAK